MAEHQFHLRAHWPGLRNDVGHIETGQLQTKVSIPPEMDGPGIGTNPDEMLLGAAATCYIISLAAMLERAAIKATIDMQSDGIVDVTNGVFTYQQIIHKLTLKLAERTEKNEKMAERLAFKAESTCMISKALKGNVEVLVKLTIE